MPEAGATTRVEVAGRTLRLSSLDKILYPATETTKGEILHYYAQIAPVLLPLMAGRPVTRVRWPHGVEQQSFFEKNLPPGAPAWLPRVGFDGVTYPLVNDLAELTYLVNLNSLEFHVPQWRVSADLRERSNPDRLVIDLDPGRPAGLRECAQVALHVRERLGLLGLELFPVTSGSKGMQLYAALGGDLTSDQVRDIASTLAQELTRRFPDLVLWRMTKSLRPGKIFLDWSQNVAAKTTICPYSLRGRETPTVAAPRTWAEVEAAATDEGVLEQVLFEDALVRLERFGDLLASLA
ncbi:MAG: non-homologous end-joining DNA ligase [Tetrasphaera sp.]|nr:non-homologous end-joining DNA ligase [Tetrasphaera sp.]